MIPTMSNLIDGAATIGSVILESYVVVIAPDIVGRSDVDALSGDWGAVYGHLHIACDKAALAHGIQKQETWQKQAIGSEELSGYIQG